MVSLVIVESPAKIKMVGDILAKLFGKGRYRVLASYGHIRDLPDDALGIDIAAGFRPQYVVSEAKKNVVKRLKAAVKEADSLYLASDPDREGESIAWHLVQTLKPSCPVKRVTFNAITESAIKAGFAASRPIDMALVAAQESRRILDRLVGYKISPILWDRLPNSKGLSAGRVQSVALGLVVERQRDIDVFQPKEYWSIVARFATAFGSFEAKLQTWCGQTWDSTLWTNQKGAEAVAQAFTGVSFTISQLEQFSVPTQPAAPFTTATLLQAASTHLSLAPDQTMQAAQKLYEAGHITYLRTDSVAIAPLALQTVRQEIVSRFGPQYLAAPRVFTTKEAEQGQECIRPTHVEEDQLSVSDAIDEMAAALYRLIWQRFAACQMADAVHSQTVAQVSGGESMFRVVSREMTFNGFLSVYDYGDDIEPVSNTVHKDITGALQLPILIEGEVAQMVEIVPKKIITQPPRALSEAGLIHELGTRGVGRSSTFASTVSALKTRGTVSSVKKILVPTEIGMRLIDFLVTHFSKVFDVGFTAQIEAGLDEIAVGSQTAPVFLSAFWREFTPLLEAVRASPAKPTVPQSGLECPRCHGRLVIRTKHDSSQFLGCEAFPQCRYSRAIDSSTREANHEVCTRCGKPLISKDGRNGAFVGCSGFPDCRFTRAIEKV